MQWEYCSIQTFEERGVQQSSQQGGYSSQGTGSSFLDRLLGVYPVSGKTPGGTTYVVSYVFYRVHGLESHEIYDGNDPDKADEETSKYIAILGMYGWEAIHVVRQANGLEHWYFKRKIDPSNQYLTF